MKLSEIGEFGFIDRLSGKFKHLLLPEYLGIGDDCAIMPFNDEEDYVVTTDLLIEDIHFLKDRITPFQLGHKSLAVNLSDIAAMGAKPVGSFLSIGIPSETEVEYLDSFMKGYHELSQKYQVPLLGGDTTKSKKYLTINVGIVGKCRRGKARLRSMAQNDDIVCVTGFLGDSAGGLEVLLHNLPETKDNLKLIQSHHLPEPHINEGLWLAKQSEIHAMIDVSDGISSDLLHILKASGKSAVVDLDKIPVSDKLKRVTLAEGWDLYKLVTSGGEDYVLLCTLKAGSFEPINTGFKATFDRDLIQIGKIIEGEPRINWTKNGEPHILNQHGFDHFNDLATWKSSIKGF
ncbi:MAG TPA: thiamine-phosphate kinase [Bacteroidales bacterium]|nr:thiamine-phosphate kinase [Bacteroidales bacterium]